MRNVVAGVVGAADVMEWWAHVAVGTLHVPIAQCTFRVHGNPRMWNVVAGVVGAVG